MSYREKLGYELNSMRRDIERTTGLNIKEISYRTQTSINSILLIEAGNMLTVETLAQYMIRLQEVRETEAVKQMFEDMFENAHKPDEKEGGFRKSNQLDKGVENNAERKKTTGTRRRNKSRS